MEVFIDMYLIKKFNEKHYNFYSDKADNYLKNYVDIVSWKKKLRNDDLLIWIRFIYLIENNCYEYYGEISIGLTILIKMFKIELGIEDQNIEISYSNLEKIIQNFKKIIYSEYSNRKNLLNEKINFKKIY